MAFNKVVVFLFFLVIAPHAYGQSHYLLGKLKPGKYHVGFKSEWKFDYSRRYVVTTENSSSDKVKNTINRPLLINVWYPVKIPQKPVYMKHREYFDIEPKDEKLKRFAQTYRNYNLSVIAAETFSKTRDKFSEEEETLFNEFLNSKTASIKNGLAIPKKFPLIIYHQGYGASFEDNSVLCEYLASKGYIVIGSSFLRESGGYLGIDGKAGSVRDIMFLMNFASGLQNADLSKVGIVGHSGGAQAAIIAKSNSHMAISAVVSLETTDEPFNLTDPRWQSFQIPVLKNSNQMRGPLLAFAGYNSIFQLYDSLKNMDRIYITLPNLVNHNDYLSQGILARKLRYRLEQNKKSKTNNKTLQKIEAIETYYQRICGYILAFMQAELKEVEKARGQIKSDISNNPFRQNRPNITFMKSGQERAKPYKSDKNRPPHPRQIRGLIDEKGINSTISVLNSFKSEKDFNPIYNEIFVFSLINDYLDKGKKDTAQALFDYYGGTGVKIKKRFLSLSSFVMLFRQRKFGKKLLRRLLILDPQNEKAKAKLKELEK